MTRRIATLLVCLATFSLAQGQTQDPIAAPLPAAPDASQAVPAAPACLTCGGSGQDEPGEWTDLPLSERETLTNDWFGLGAKLRDEGIEVALSLTQIYQINLHGGLSTHRRSGRYAGSYDLETLLDMDTLAGLPGGSVYMLAEGSWSDGLDPSSVGSLYGVNADAAGDEAAYISQLWYEQAMLGDRVRVRAGKIDLTGGFECQGCLASFDGNRYANDQTLQFLNGALVNNPTIPFPDPGLGAMVITEPTSWWYVSAGAADAQADVRETGFNTAFHDEDHFLSLVETGFLPVIPTASGGLPGAYRFGAWYDPQDKERFDRPSTKRDDTGAYLSFDQMVYREAGECNCGGFEDHQGLGLFMRAGLADRDVNDLGTFWSVGSQYRGLLPGRDWDVLGVGYARGNVSSEAGYTEPHESVLETYYNCWITPWLSVSPSVQYIWHGGADEAVDNATVIGLRAQMFF